MGKCLPEFLGVCVQSVIELIVQTHVLTIGVCLKLFFVNQPFSFIWAEALLQLFPEYYVLYLLLMALFVCIFYQML